MLLGLLIACSALAAGPDAKSEDRAAYEAARSRAGRDADAHVKLALWCEQHGLSGERAEHLALAAALDPANALARGLMGLVADGGKWRRPEAITRRAQDDADTAAKLAEYARKRSKAVNTAESQWDLATWCLEQGLKAEATAHLTAVTRLDPRRDAAWKRLGYKKVGRHWKTDAQVAEEKQEAEAQKNADAQWSHALTRLKAELRDPRKKAAAEAALAGVTDPRALPMILKTFGAGELRDRKVLVQLLGQIDAPRSSRALAMMAIFAEDASIRRAAVETLRLRDPREFADVWIGLIRAELKYEVRPVGGPGSPGVLLIEGEQFDRTRFYMPPAVAYVPQWNDRISYDDGIATVTRDLGNRPVNNYNELRARDALKLIPSVEARIAQFGGDTHLTMMLPDGEATNLRNSKAELKVLKQIDPRTNDPRKWFVAQGTVEDYVVIPVGMMMLQAQRTALAAEQQLESDVDAVKAFNQSIRSANDLVTQALRDVTGQDFGDNAQAWLAWWTDAQGYAYVPPPQMPRQQIVEEVPLAYQPPPLAPIAVTLPGRTKYSISEHHSCFAAGTLVQTRTGERPIEALAAGDLVLTHDRASKGLGFQPILRIYHNPPAATFKVRLGDDCVVATGIHRFWKAGKGWVMARDLKPGDLVRTVEGIARVTAVEPERVQPVFNLEVAEGHSFFVGKAGALVHDNSLVRPTPEPFDAVARLGDPAK